VFGIADVFGDLLNIIVGLLNPLDCPHHVRQEEKSPFREGVVIEKKPPNGDGVLVNAGLKKVNRCDIFACTNVSDCFYMLIVCSNSTKSKARRTRHFGYAGLLNA